MRTRPAPASEDLGAPRRRDEVPSALSEAERTLTRYASTVAEFRRTRRSLEEFNEFAARPPYGKLISELRRAAVLVRTNPNNTGARALLDLAASALDVPVIDLETLARVPPDSVASGAWRPRSVNVDLVDPDPTTRLGPETRFQKKLNALSSKLPGVKEIRIPGLSEAYFLASELAPVFDAFGKRVADPIDAAGVVVRGWSDTLATEVEHRLRDIRSATSPSGLTMGDIAALPECEQRMFLMAAEKLSGMTLDAEEFIGWARDPDPGALSTGLAARLKGWASAGLYSFANFLRGAAGSIRTVTNEDGWRTFTVHVQVGAGLEKFTVTTRAGVTIMFPTIEQTERDGAAIVRIVSRLNPVETMFGGMTLTSRGGGMKFRAGPVGAKISEFEHEVKAGIPGIIGLSMGEDYAYGPSIAFGYSPPIGLLGVLPLPVNVRVGGEVTIFHPALGGRVSQGTRKLAEQVSIACDGTGAALRAIGRALGLVGKSNVESHVGWPILQRWNLARRVTERAEAACALAIDRLARMKAISPDRLIDTLGVERTRALLGRDAENPRKTHETITRYLESLIREIERRTEEVRKMASEAVERKSFDKKELRQLTHALTRHTLAFEFVDVLLASLLAVEREAVFAPATKATAPPRVLRAPHQLRAEVTRTGAVCSTTMDHPSPPD